MECGIHEVTKVFFDEVYNRQTGKFKKNSELGVFSMLEERK